jgi:hypothetical protein
MDNTGLYVTYGQLLLEMYLASNTKVTASDITLSNKTVDAGGDIYEYVTTGALNIKDVLTQAGETDCIIEILSGPDRIRVEKTGSENLIVNGPAKFLHSETLPKSKAERYIKTAMNLIDEKTGQFFNKREGTFPIEGRNTALMHLPVPIIEIDELRINSTSTILTEGEDYDFVAFKGRQTPTDDRKNPRIKLNIGRAKGSIFTNSITSRLFVKGSLTHITGSFGYLEPDGSTPLLIQKAVLILVMLDINKPVGSSVSATSGTGPLKRLKVDLHEQEFFEASSNKESVRSSDSGNEEVDRIISLFRTPIRVGGSFMHRKTDELSKGFR